MFDHGEGVVGVERFTGRFKRSQITRVISSFICFIWVRELSIHRKLRFLDKLKQGPKSDRFTEKKCFSI